MATNKKLKVWMHNPRANPIWIDDDNYLEWRTPDADPEPTSTQLDAAGAAYETAETAGAVELSSDKSSITGNGTDAATVTVTYRLPFPDVVTLRIAGKEAQIPFSAKGIGAPFTRSNTIDNLVSSVPGETIVIEVVKWGSYDVPGGDELAIEVTA